MNGPSNDRPAGRVPIILVRHGLTEWNDRGLIQGWTDIPLSETGRRQADATARALTDRRVAGVVSSDLVRARETAGRIAAAHRLPVRDDAALREYHCGDWEGRPFRDVRRDHPGAFRAWFDDPESPIPGGESMGAALRRAAPALDASIAAAPADGALVVVAHGGILRLLAAHLLGMPIAHARRFALDNGSISVFEPFLDGWMMKLWNATGHLEGLDGGPDAARPG
jgi:broad specificity phosphatase PhoE